MKKFLKALLSLIICLTVITVPVVTLNAADSYKLTLKDFSADSEVYNDNVAKAASLILYYGVCGESVMRSALSKVYNLSNIVYTIKTAATEIDHFISSKKLGGDNGFYLVSVSLINSFGAQWYDNFDPGTGDIHRGFAAGEEYFEKIFDKYMADNIPEGKPVKLLIAGHSRGAAIANLFAKKLIDSEKYTAKENIFTYTFASPNNSKARDLREEKYLRIFNFINPEDLVPRCMPEEWGYGRYGTDIILPGKANGSGKIGGRYIDYAEYRSRMTDKFKLYSGQTFCSSYSGEEPLYDLFKTITGRITNVEDMYKVKMNAGIDFKTMYEFFTTTVCPIVSERFSAEDNETFRNGIINLLTTWLMPNTCTVYRQFTDYMMETEGFAAARDWLKSKNADVDSLTPDSVLKLLLPENIYSKFGRLILRVSEFKLDQLIDAVKTAPGHIFNSAHNISAYMAFVTTMSEAELLCPRSTDRTEIVTDRDVEVYRKDTGALVGRTVRNVADKEFMRATSSVVLSIKDGKVIVWLPNTENYEIKYVDNSADELRLRYRSSARLKSAGENTVYTSGDLSIARVDAQGTVTGTGTGSVLISAADSSSGTAEKSFTKVTVYYAWWQYVIKYLALGFLWY